MKIALVWNAPVRLTDITTRFEPYVEGLHEFGVEAITVCPEGMDEGFPYPVRTFRSEEELRRATFWQELSCDAILMITWHRMTDILNSAKQAGLKVIAVGESDGQVSPRHHPWQTFRFMTYLQATLRGKVGAAKHWLERYCLQAVVEHRSISANTAAADVYTLAGVGPVAAFRALLARIGSAHLVERVRWLPYPIPESFCSGSVVTDRPAHVMAIGRWESPQKNAGLLERTAARLAEATSIQITIIGAGAEARFGHLARRHSTVRVLGTTPRTRVRDMLANSRSLLIPSRWEGCPIVASEVLALGGTVVGTPIVSVVGLVDGGKFGSVARYHRSADLARAVMAEMAAWDRGERHPEQIAAHWRKLVSPNAVAKRMLELLGHPVNSSDEGVPA